MSTNAIFVVAQRGFSVQVEIKIGKKIRFARTNSSSGNPPLFRYVSSDILHLINQPTVILFCKELDLVDSILGYTF